MCSYMYKKRRIHKTGEDRLLLRPLIAKVISEVMKPLVKLLAIPVVILVRLLRPIVVIRFGPLRSKRIGHFAANTELYLCERDAGMHGRRVYDFFYHRMPICNQQLAKMWARVLHIYSVNRYFDKANRRLPGWEKHWNSIYERGDVDCLDLLEHTKPHLAFTSEEEKRGLQKLQALGIPPENGKFVCFYARDKAYVELLIRPAQEHTARRHDYRDSSISNYVPAVQELVRRGYFALRMGAAVKEPLSTDEPKIIDYATCTRDDFMDIFLCAKCKFFLGSPSGISAIPRIFRKPVVYTDFIPLGIDFSHRCGPNCLIIPKKLWLRKERRFLTFREILDSGIGKFWLSEQYEKFGIEVIDNTSEEILDLAVEMDEWLRGTGKAGEEDEQLQRRFWLLFNQNNMYKKPTIRIGTKFLRQNIELLSVANG